MLRPSWNESESLLQEESRPAEVLSEDGRNTEWAVRKAVIDTSAGHVSTCRAEMRIITDLSVSVIFCQKVFIQIFVFSLLSFFIIN